MIMSKTGINSFGTWHSGFLMGVRCEVRFLYGQGSGLFSREQKVLERERRAQVNPVGGVKEHRVTLATCNVPGPAITSLTPHNKPGKSVSLMPFYHEQMELNRRANLLINE